MLPRKQLEQEVNAVFVLHLRANAAVRLAWLKPGTAADVTRPGISRAVINSNAIFPKFHPSKSGAVLLGMRLTNVL